MEFFRRRQQGLGQNLDLFGPDGDFAGFGFAQLAFGPDDIAQIQQLNHLPFVGQQLLAEAKLNRTVRVTHGQENQLADIPQQHNTPAAPGLAPFLISGFDDFRQFRIRHPLAIRIDSHLHYFLAFFTTHLFKFTACCFSQFHILSHSRTGNSLSNAYAAEDHIL